VPGSVVDVVVVDVVVVVLLAAELAAYAGGLP